MRSIKTTSGAEIALDGDLLAVMEALYKEVTAKRALERTFENEGRVRTFFGDGRYGRLLHSLSSQTGSCSRRA